MDILFFPHLLISKVWIFHIYPHLLVNLIVDNWCFTWNIFAVLWIKCFGVKDFDGISFIINYLHVLIRLTENTYGLFLYTYFSIKYFDDDVSRETLLHPNLYFVISALLILTYYNKLCCYMITGNRCNECFDSYFCTSLNNRKLHIELLDGIYYNKFFCQVRVITSLRSEIYYHACCNGHASR